jgi:hypothetical protein
MAQPGVLGDFTKVLADRLCGQFLHPNERVLEKKKINTFS